VGVCLPSLSEPFPTTRGIADLPVYDRAHFWYNFLEESVKNQSLAASTGLIGGKKWIHRN
jgi:hypothetical protein